MKTKVDLFVYAQSISVKSLRDAILDNKVKDTDTIILQPDNFDEIVIDYRRTYNESIILPYFLLGVLIEEDTLGRVKDGQIGIVKNDTSNPARQFEKTNENDLPREIVFRCGWCGNVVDSDGGELTDRIKKYRLRQIEKYGDDIVEKVHGICCKS